MRLDTHVVVWLYTGEVERFSSTARSALEHDVLVISPIVELELAYLHEIGRLTVAGAAVVADLRTRLGLALSALPTSAVVAAASRLTWTRDPFDRLIVGDAAAGDEPLLTKDGIIRENFPQARW